MMNEELGGINDMAAAEKVINEAADSLMVEAGGDAVDGGGSSLEAGGSAVEASGSAVEAGGSAVEVGVSAVEAGESTVVVGESLLGEAGGSAVDAAGSMAETAGIITEAAGSVMEFVPFAGVAYGVYSLGFTVKDIIQEKKAAAAERLREIAKEHFQDVKDPKREHSLDLYTILPPAWCDTCKCLLYGVINKVCMINYFWMVDNRSLQALYCSLCGMNFHNTAECLPANDCSCLMQSQVNPLFKEENTQWRNQVEEKKFIGLVNETSKSVQFQSSRSLRTRTQVYKTEEVLRNISKFKSER